MTSITTKAQLVKEVFSKDEKNIGKSVHIWINIFGLFNPDTWLSGAKNWNYGCQTGFMTDIWSPYWVISFLSLLPCMAGGVFSCINARRSNSIGLIRIHPSSYFKSFDCLWAFLVYPFYSPTNTGRHLFWS